MRVRSENLGGGCRNISDVGSRIDRLIGAVNSRGWIDAANDRCNDQEARSIGIA